MRAIRGLLATAAVAATLAGAPSGHATSDPIQPGDYMASSVGSCTLNFVYDGSGTKAGKVYLGTAAHCVDRVGEDIELLSGEVFGDVAVIGNDGNTADDWALIEVRAAFLPRVYAGVLGNTVYPKGHTVSTETATGDMIQQSGYGLGFDLTSVTRERRQAVLVSDTASVWRAAGAWNFGDSGGPLIHIKTGKALGIESRVCIGACTDEGPTVEGILARALAKGFPVAIRPVTP